jgi:hypothetical protein
MPVFTTSLDKDLSQTLCELTTAIAVLEKEKSKEARKKLTVLVALKASFDDLQIKLNRWEAAYEKCA